MVDKTSTYQILKDFKKRYPRSLTWFRIKQHANLVDQNLQPNEKVIFAFAAQWCEGDGWFDTAVMALTTERIIVAQNRLIAGFRVISIAPKFFNDVKVRAGVIWGTVTIDTAKEKIYFTKVARKALLEIKNTVSKYMLEYKTQILSGSFTTDDNNQETTSQS